MDGTYLLLFDNLSPHLHIFRVFSCWTPKTGVFFQRLTFRSPSLRLKQLPHRSTTKGHALPPPTQHTSNQRSSFRSSRSEGRYGADSSTKAAAYYTYRYSFKHNCRFELPSIIFMGDPDNHTRYPYQPLDPTTAGPHLRAAAASTRHSSTKITLLRLSSSSSTSQPSVI